MPDRPPRTPATGTAAKAGKPDERRLGERANGMRALAAPISKAARAALKRRGLASGRIVAEWPEIVGATLAGCSCPERLSAPRDGGPGTLKVRVDGPLAIELQHLEPVIVERINGYFGYRAVKRLAMVRGPLPARRDAKPAPPPAPDAAALKTAAERAAGIENEALREALISLGGHVLARGREPSSR